MPEPPVVSEAAASIHASGIRFVGPQRTFALRMRALPRGSLLLCSGPRLCADFAPSSAFVRRENMAIAREGQGRFCGSCNFVQSQRPSVMLARRKTKRSNRFRRFSRNRGVQARTRKICEAHTSRATVGKRSCKACTVNSSCRRASMARTAASAAWNRRDARDAVGHGRGADASFVGAGAFAAGGVDNQLHCPSIR